MIETISDSMRFTNTSCNSCVQLELPACKSRRLDRPLLNDNRTRGTDNDVTLNSVKLEGMELGSSLPMETGARVNTGSKGMGPVKGASVIGEGVTGENVGEGVVGSSTGLDVIG